MATERTRDLQNFIFREVVFATRLQETCPNSPLMYLFLFSYIFKQSLMFSLLQKNSGKGIDETTFQKRLWGFKTSPTFS